METRLKCMAVLLLVLLAALRRQRSCDLTLSGMEFSVPPLLNVNRLIPPIVNRYH
jgi:hypothetical protein